MFVPRTFNYMRLIALVGTMGLIGLVSGFTYEAGGFPFVGGAGDDPAELTVEEILEAELTPAEAAASAVGGGIEPGIGVDLTPTSVGTFVAPVEAFTRPGDDRTFVVEQIGRVVTIAGEEMLNISDRTVADAERGMLGAAFHPTEPLLYTHYNDAAGDTIIAEYIVDESGVADASTERIVLFVDQPYDNHNGGEITFGPDGFLYIGLGDGGLANDPDRAALDLASPLGKILRIDPTSGADGSAFSVPADNPFVDTPGTDPTIWSYGLRNPWKFSFDQNTGDLWIADVGQDLWEEINVAVAVDGRNAGRGVSFGWSAFEGNERFNDDQPADGHLSPLVTYLREDGNCSVSGGSLYHGQALAAEISGWYVYGDFCTGIIWGFDPTEASPEIVQLAQVEALAAIATGGDGELYAVSIAGDVSRLER